MKLESWLWTFFYFLHFRSGKWRGILFGDIFLDEWDKNSVAILWTEYRINHHSMHFKEHTDKLLNWSEQFKLTFVKMWKKGDWIRLLVGIKAPQKTRLSSIFSKPKNVIFWHQQQKGGRGVNFTNILCEAFLYKSFARSYFVLTF